MISGISVSAGVVTVVLSAPSGIAAGDLITVAGASPSKYNGVNFAVRTSIDNGTTLTYVDETAKGAKPGTTGRIELGACGADCGGVDALTGLADSPAFNAIPRSAASNPIVRMVCSVSLQLESVRGDVVTIKVKTASPTGHAVAAANCPWSVGPLPSWIRLQNPALGEGLGPGTVTLQLLPTAALEQAMVEIGGAFIPVHQ